MAKENVVVVPKTKKQKFLNVLKIFGICCGGMVGLVAIIVLYVWISGGFNPPFVELTEMHFSQNEYVISDLDSIRLVPNEGCTELDNVTIKVFDTNVLKLVEDDNTKPVVSDEQNTDEPQVSEKYTTVIGADIQIEPVKQIVNAGTENEKEINVGGWVKLVAERGLITTDCWVFVDVGIESLDMEVKTELDEVLEQELETYVVYPNSVIQLGTKNVFPSTSFNVPSTTLSTDVNGKTSTLFSNKKNIYYVVSDDTLATVNNETGTITVAENAEGSFTVYAYVVSEYNNIGNEPKLEDYIENFGTTYGYANWEQDFDQIRIKTQKIQFNIKDVQVEDISVAREKLTFDLLSKNNQVQINYIDTKTNKIDSTHSNVYHYAVDLQLSYDSASKGIMFENVLLFAGYIDNQSAVENKIYVDKRENWVVLDDTYIKVSQAKVNHSATPRQVSWDIVVNEYKASGNVLVFAYPFDNNGNTEYIYDYVEVAINKVSIEGLSFDGVEKEINLDWNETQATVETLDLANTVSVNPSNATYNNKNHIKYFALADNGVLEVDSNLKIKTTDQKTYYAICKTSDTETKYNIVNPVNYGTANIVAVVLIYDANGELITDGEGYYKFDYIGNLSDSITVKVQKALGVIGIDILNATGESILNNDAVIISKGDTITLKITCDDELTNDNAFVWAIEGDGKQDMMSQTGIVTIENKNTLVYTLCADKDGVFNLYIANTKGNKVANVNIVAFEVLNTDLRALTLDSNGINGVGVKLTPSSYQWVVYDQNGNLTTESLNFEVRFDPVNTNNKAFSLYAYAVEDDFDAGNLDQLKIEELDLSDILTFTENEGVWTPNIHKQGKAVVYAITPSGEIISNPILIEIKLPDIRVEYSYGNQQSLVSENELVKSLVAYDSNDEQNANDPRQGDKFRIGVYEKTEDGSVNNGKIYYILENEDFVAVQNPSAMYLQNYYEFIDIGELIKYKFADEFTEEEGVITSIKSNAKIDNINKTLQLSDIDGNLQETIVMYTDFGFETRGSQSFIYNLIADYKATKNSYEYYAPSYADIFADGFEEVEVPLLTNIGSYFEIISGQYVLTSDTELQAKTYYRYIEPAVRFTNYAGNKLYLPKNYNLANLTDYYKNQFVAQVETPVVEDINKYYELVSGVYQLTQDTIIDTSKTYYIYNISQTLTLSSNGTDCAIDSTTGRVKAYKIPAEDITTTISIAITYPDGTTGYMEKYSFTIKAGVKSEFSSDTTDNGTPIKIVNVTLNENTLENNTLTLNDYDLKYQNLNESTVQISNINLMLSGSYPYNFGVLNNKVVKYVLTADKALDDEKTYFVKTDYGFEVVELPSADQIANYYEVTTIVGFDDATKTLTLYDEVLNDNMTSIKIKLEVKASVVNQGISTTLTDYYFIRFDLPFAN